MRSIELFSGAGGLALAVHLAGFEHQLLVEVDYDAYETLLHNSRGETVPGVSRWPVVHGRVEAIDFNNYGEIDLLAAGIPCQPFSNGGRRCGIDDDRNMFPIFAAALATVRPKAFLLENVNGLINGKLASHMEYILLQLSHPWSEVNDGETWKEHYEQLRLMARNRVHERPSYDVLFKVLNAADYGVPQIRKRVFIVGFRNDLQTRWDFPSATHSKEALLDKQRQEGTHLGGENMSARRLPQSSENKTWVTVQDAIRDLPDAGTEHAKVMQHVLIPGARSYKGHTGSPLNWPAKSLKAGTHGVGGGENMLRYDNGEVRYFTIRECARLQTFPDSWVFKGAWSSITRQLGNAVPVQMVVAVAKSLKDTLMRPPR